MFLGEEKKNFKDKLKLVLQLCPVSISELYNVHMNVQLNLHLLLFRLHALNH